MKSEAGESAELFVNKWDDESKMLLELADRIKARDRAMRLEGIRAGIEASKKRLEENEISGHRLDSLDPSLVLGEKEKGEPR